MSFPIKLYEPESGFDIALGCGENLTQKMLVTDEVYVSNFGHTIYTYIEGEGLVFYGYGGLDNDETESLTAASNTLIERNSGIGPQRQAALRGLAGLN